MIPCYILAIENESDREFIEQVYLKYHYLLFSEIKNIVGNQWDAEDILQTVLLKLINKIETLRQLSEPQLISYICTASRNVSYNFCRDKKNICSLFEESFQDQQDNQSIENILINQEDMKTLSEVWGELDDKTKYLLSARFLLHKSEKEIAADLKMSYGSVRMAVVRAKRKALHAMVKKQTC